LAVADLEGLLPMALESMQDEGGHGDRRLHATQGFLYFSDAKGGIRIGVCQIGSPYLGLNNPASRHAQGRQQSRSVTSMATHVSHTHHEAGKMGVGIYY